MNYARELHASLQTNERLLRIFEKVSLSYSLFLRDGLPDLGNEVKSVARNELVVSPAAEGPVAAWEFDSSEARGSLDFKHATSTLSFLAIVSPGQKLDIITVADLLQENILALDISVTSLRVEENNFEQTISGPSPADFNKFLFIFEISGNLKL